MTKRVLLIIVFLTTTLTSCGQSNVDNEEISHTITLSKQQIETIKLNRPKLILEDVSFSENDLGARVYFSDSLGLHKYKIGVVFPSHEAANERFIFSLDRFKDSLMNFKKNKDLYLVIEPFNLRDDKKNVDKSKLKFIGFEILSDSLN